MFLFEGFKNRSRRRQEDWGDTDSVRRIAGALGRIDGGRSRYLAAFAYVLSRAAGADLDISRAEIDHMIAVIEQAGPLSRSQAALVAETAAAQNRRYRGTEDYLVTREFRAISTPSERRELVYTLFAVAASDGGIAPAEESEIREIAKELGITPPEYLAIRREWSSGAMSSRGLG